MIVWSGNIADDPDADPVAPDAGLDGARATSDTAPDSI